MLLAPERGEAVRGTAVQVEKLAGIGVDADVNAGRIELLHASAQAIEVGLIEFGEIKLRLAVGGEGRVLSAATADWYQRSWCSRRWGFHRKTVAQPSTEA